jgi:hypothetical protein
MVELWMGRVCLYQGLVVIPISRQSFIRDTDRWARRGPRRRSGARDAAILDWVGVAWLAVDSWAGKLYPPRTCASAAVNEGRSGCWPITAGDGSTR